MSTIDRPAMQTPGFAGEPPREIAPDDPSQVERTIKPSRGWIAIDWKELYHSRELFDTLIMRDIKIRYKQTVLGVFWAILQPLATMIVLSLVFGSFTGAKPEGVPYPLFIFAGLVPWTFFSSSVGGAGVSLLSQQHLLTKIYFPRLYVPASIVGANLVDMAIGLGLFGFLMPFYHFVPSANLVFLPFVIVLTFAAALGIGLVLASITILYRDLRFVIPFVMQLMMFASPLLLQMSKLSTKVQFLIAFNPMSGIITTFRWCILGMPLDLRALLISIFMTTVFLTFGLFFFRKSERFFADIL